jgi:hypothetical protein
MIPKILYHGTSAVRYAKIKREGMMKCNMPKYYLSDKTIAGYLFFTDNLKEAAINCLNTYLTDQRMNYMQILVKSHSMFRDGIVIAVRTSALKDGFEVDPEHYSVNIPGNLEIARELGVNWKSTWYRHRGDIPMKYLFPYKIAPYSQWPERTIDSVNQGIDTMELRDLQFK